MGYVFLYYVEEADFWAVRKIINAFFPQDSKFMRIVQLGRQHNIDYFYESSGECIFRRNRNFYTLDEKYWGHYIIQMVSPRNHTDSVFSCVWNVAAPHNLFSCCLC